MTIALKIQGVLERASWIRKMFEEGARLKAKYGPENVFDFSLGNPNLSPPPRFHQALMEAAKNSGGSQHSYMPNTGYPLVKKAVAESISAVQGIAISAEDVIMTCGAAGALNVIFKAILDPGDQVITPRPYFMEYDSYVDNHGGILKAVASKDDFSLDFDAIKNGINAQTKAVLINSPNNPSGRIYSEESLKELGELLHAEGYKLRKTIYLVDDEPYSKIIFDGAKVPPLFSCYKESIIATSYSKDLSIPGERIGYLVVHPDALYKEGLLAGMALTNRILGYVNAPALMQRIVATLQGISVDASLYQKKRDLLCAGLASLGYDFVIPEGTFYLFPKTPIPDDVAFVKALQKERILTVPGSGFGCPGYFRIAFCVDDDTITNAMPGFGRVLQQL